MDADRVPNPFGTMNRVVEVAGAPASRAKPRGPLMVRYYCFAVRRANRSLVDCDSLSPKLISAGPVSASYVPCSPAPRSAALVFAPNPRSLPFLCMPPCKFDTLLTLRDRAVQTAGTTACETL